MRQLKTVLIAAVLILPVYVNAEHVLRYDQPAKKWSAEALPLGNGQIGCMVFGGVDQERIQFNADSLWTGDENPTGDYGGMGAFQNFGDLFIDLGSGGSGGSGVFCASGQKAFYQHEEIEFSVDGLPETKWCVEHKDKPVVWELRLSKAEIYKSYTFTSCRDVPQRDPRTWEVSGSNDGKEWTLLDKRENQPQIEPRGGMKSYSFENTAAYKFYRISIVPGKDVPHMQVAEINFGGAQIKAGDKSEESGYERQLNLNDALHKVSFQKNGVTHSRTMFVSHPDNVIVLKWNAGKPGSISGAIRLKGAHNESTKVQGNTIGFSGKLDNGLEYETLVRVIVKGGKVTGGTDALNLEGCDEALILQVVGTDYVMDYARKYKGDHPGECLRKQLEAAEKMSYEDLLARHMDDYHKLFNRTDLFLGKSSSEVIRLPVDRRLKVYADGGADPELEATLFQMGRYLMISCSRRPGLPANLQGLWNDSNNPPWHSDYHANINVQMNYWPAEPANMPDCHLPFFDLIQSQLEPWRKATQAEKEFAKESGRVRGWTVRTSHNISGGLGWKWDKTSNAWYCLHLWEHYAFTGDRQYLEKTAYPIIREVCEFWEDQLKALPDGRLVIPNSWSPEHGPDEDGVSYSQEIVWDLFNNYVEAADVLGYDRDYRDKVGVMRDKLVTPKIGKWGQLQEWMTDRDDPKDQHRHTSHLFAVYPGRQISVSKTPELAKAAAISLAARGEAGDSRRSWTWPWRCALWARLGEPENAYRMVRGLLTYNILPNLFGNHPPFQMDGNFGITAAMCEMLVQSQAGEIELLPGLPKAWPEGSVKGLKARGNFTVDISWADGKVKAYKISSPERRKVMVRIGDKVETVTAK